MSTTKPLQNFHFLTEAQYEQETISQNDIYAVKMTSITTDEIVKTGLAQSVLTLTDTEKTTARTNIGAGTSNFSGDYNDLTNKPSMPRSIRKVVL